MSTNVRLLGEADRDAWHRLWDGYCDFYAVDMPAEVTAKSWERLLEDDTPDFFGLVAERDGEVIGIANCILHGTTWAIAPRCYLNDLFVDPGARGTGAGKAMVDHLLRLAAKNGWDRVHWLTAETNEMARRLYDQFTPASGFIQYRVNPEQP